MLGQQDRDALGQSDLFAVTNPFDLIPQDHILRRVDRVLDLSWLREEVRECYCAETGRPSIDPEAAVRLMLAGFFQGITQDRKLMREAEVNLAIRWFAGYRLQDRLPHASSLTRIRQRWGEERFRRIFLRTVKQCQERGLVSGETVHIDATLIRADVSWESLHAEKVLAENREEEEAETPKRGRPRTRPRYPKKRSRTDPECTLATSSKDRAMEPTYKQHTAVDDAQGVVVDVSVTTGEAPEGQELIGQLDRVETVTERPVATVTADAAYGNAETYGVLERHDIDALIVPRTEYRKPRRIPARRFKYDARHQVVRCPGGKELVRGHRVEAQRGTIYRARSSDCRGCPLRARCLPPTARSRQVMIVDDYPALLRARRRHARGAPEDRRLHRRHRHVVEGVHGEAKQQHGLRRAARRGLWNVAIQVYLTAAAINLKRLAKAFCRAIVSWRGTVHETGNAFCGAPTRLRGSGRFRIEMAQRSRGFYSPRPWRLRAA